MNDDHPTIKCKVGLIQEVSTHKTLQRHIELKRVVSYPTDTEHLAYHHLHLWDEEWDLSSAMFDDSLWWILVHRWLSISLSYEESGWSIKGIRICVFNTPSDGLRLWPGAPDLFFELSGSCPGSQQTAQLFIQYSIYVVQSTKAGKAGEAISPQLCCIYNPVLSSFEIDYRRLSTVVQNEWAYCRRWG